MNRRLALSLCLAAAAVAACQGSSEQGGGALAPSDAAAAQRLRPGNFNALATSRRGQERAVLASMSRSGPRSGAPSFLWSRRTGAPPAAPAGKRTAAEVARAHLRARAAELGLTAADVDGARVARVRDAGRGPVVVRFRQQIRGVEVFRDQAAVALDRAGGLVAISGSLAPAADAPPGDDSTLDARDAVALALGDVSGEYFAAGDLVPLAAANGWGRFDLTPAVAAARGERLTRPARAKQVWFRLPGRLVPAIQLELSLARLGEIARLDYGYVISATDGSVLFRRDLSQEAGYRVFADAAAPFAPFDGPQGTSASPHPTGTPDGFQAPLVPQQLVSLDSGPISTLDPWLPGGENFTVGNNADAYADISGADGFDASDVRGVMSAGTFGYPYDYLLPPTDLANQQTAIAQLFYTVNWLHDWFYDAGFDEVAGNAQDDNYTRGGLGGDPILAEAQDFRGTDFALMTTFADGQSPVLEVSLWWPHAEQYLDYAWGGATPTSGRTAAGVARFFGPASFALTGELVLANDGDPLAQPLGGTPSDGCEGAWLNAADVAGKIALVDRGGPPPPAPTCTFVTKAANAQAAGAIGIVVRNIASSSTVGDMSGTSGSIAIPAQLIDKATGDAIGGELALSNPVTVTMFREAAPMLDGALDTSVVAHEWGHFLANRLVGDAAGLDTRGAQGLAEGWADFVSLLLLVRAEDAAAVAGSDFAGTYALGAWLASGDLPAGGGNEGYYFGARRVPYTTDLAKNPLTFKHVADGQPLPPALVAAELVAFGWDGTTNSIPHNAGEVWATMLWECYAGLLRDTLGSTPRLTFEQAQDRMKGYLVSSLQLTPVSPTLLEARDALIAVAAATDLADYRRFWEAFAKRGAGADAVGPDRWSLDNAPVVESYVAPPDLRATAVTFGAVTTPCDDADGALDVAETGSLVVTLENIGPSALGATTASISSTAPGISLPASVAVGATALGGTTQVEIPVSLSSAALAEVIPLTLTFPPGHMAIDAPVRTSFRANYDELPGNSTLDGFEAASLAWSVDADPLLTTLPNFARVELSPSAHEIFAPDLDSGSDLRFISPPLTVGTSGLTLRFKHRHAFEADPVGQAGRLFYDGGVIELSANGGASWTDVGTAAYSDDPATTGLDNNCPLPTATKDCLVDYAGNPNPLVGRPAFLGHNGSWPGYDNVTLNLGSTWNGQTILIRFRVGTDVAFGSAGWWIDDVSLTGLTNTPFTAIVADRRLCANGFPTADAGAPQTVDERDGSGNPVAVGLHAVQAAGVGETYAWIQTGGPAVQLTGGNGPDPTFETIEVLSDTLLTFQLTMGYGVLSDTATTTVLVRNVNRAPVANAGPDQVTVRGSTVQLDASASTDGDADATLSYSWTQTGGTTVTLSSATAARPTFSAASLVAGETVTFQVTVTDDKGATSSDEVTVTIANSPPVANAGPDQPTVHRADTVTLDATGSSDVDPGTTLQYTWTRIAGTPDVTLTPGTAGVVTFVAPIVAVETTYTFQVAVSDGVATTTDTVDVTIVNRPPVASAGPDRSARNGDTVGLDASASSDPDAGATLEYTWTQTDGTPVTLAGASTATPSFTASGLAAGATLTFQVSVSDGLASTTDTAVVTILNTAPTADAGPDQSAHNGDAVSLDATASSDPDGGTTLTFAWTQTLGTPVILLGGSTATPSFTAVGLTPGETLTFQLTVGDGAGGTSTDTVSIAVLNTAPTADAGADRAARNGDAVGLDASASSDPDAGTAFSYTWIQTAGTTVTLAGASTATPSFTATGLTPGETLTFQLTVGDGAGGSSTDTVSIAVLNTVPTADAGADRSVRNGETVGLDASASSDPDAGTVFTYSWIQTAGTTVTLAGASTATPSFTAIGLTPGETLTFEVSVSDGAGGTSTDTVSIAVLNTAPTADAGTDRTVRNGDAVGLDASASSDPDAGTAFTYSWFQTAGTPAILVGSSTATPAFTAAGLTPGETLTFQLTVGDGAGGTSTDTVSVAVLNTAPTANAGADRTARNGDAVGLDASASSDPDAGTVFAFSWTQTAGTTVTLAGASTATPSFTATGLTPGETLTFQLTVGDGAGGISTDTVSVAVLNTAPTANAGPDRFAKNEEPVGLDASATYDPDAGTTLTFAWTQTAGTAVTLAGASTATPTFTPVDVILGTYLEFEVAVSDGAGATSTDTVRVTIATSTPVANAGVDQTAHRRDTVMLNATASTDADPGTELLYSWTQLAGPTVSLSSATAATPTFIAPDVSGDTTLTFEVTASDGIAWSTDVVDVTIVDRTPVAIVGPDQVTYAGETVSLDASQSYDLDPGTTLSFTWTQVAGPAVTLVDGALPGEVTFTAPSAAAGTELVFEVSVSDSATASTASVTVTLRATPVAPSDPGGCSCGSGAIDPSIAALIPLGLLFRRRRRR